MILFGHFTALYGSHSQSKNGIYFPNFVYLALIFPILIKYFPKYEGKGSFLKSQIKSLYTPFLHLRLLFNMYFGYSKELSQEDSSF